MVGGAWVREGDGRAVKLHAAYGRGIRPARTVARDATWTGASARGALTLLTPEEQSGIEAGVDLLLGAGIGMHATRFDQRASRLVQPVAMVADSTVPGSRGRGIGVLRRRIAYELQNVGAIDNRGWELQASSVVGPITLAGTVSLVDSRVRHLASGYSGDLAAGDRVLEVPARTYGLNAGWSRGRWSANASLARAADWINYDRLALAAALVGVTPAQPGKPGKPGKPATPTATTTPVGTQLRSYWRTYDGVTRLDARLSMAAWRGATISLSAGNLLDRQLGEPDDVTVLPGRSLTLGVRAAF
jgi:iron complex outermembrane receptor protein